MATFPTDPESFYALRDDRTNRCVSNRDYQRLRCVVTIDPTVIDTYTGQVELLTVCNLLSRWCRDVQIILPADVRTHALLESEGEFLNEQLKGQMHDADPFGNFRVIEELDNPDVQAQLHIGGNVPKYSENVVIINASGWNASVSSSVPIPLPDAEDLNSLGAIAAACLGVAQLFKYAIRYPVDLMLADGILDFYSLVRLRPDKMPNAHPFMPPDLDLGRLLMVGAGSVGSATIFALRFLRAKAAVTVIDKDVVKIENYNRSPIFGRKNFQDNKAKAVEKYCAGSSLKVRSFDGWWDDFIQQYGRIKNEFDIWLPLANERNVRWSMQNNIPPLMIHASTTQNWGANHARHIPGIGDCLADRFPAPASEQALLCSTGNIEVDNLVVDAALPFLSVLAGALIAAELVRLQMADYPQTTNFALLDLGGPLNEVQLLNRQARDGCVCRSQQIGLFNLFNGESRYSRLWK